MHQQTTAPPVTTGPAEQTIQQQAAAELHRIADDIVRLNLPLGRSLSLYVGVLASRSDLDQWAEHLGSTVEVDVNGIPHTQRGVPLAGRYGASLSIAAQAPQESMSEVERLRARVAELEAQQSTGGAA